MKELAKTSLKANLGRQDSQAVPAYFTLTDEDIYFLEMELKVWLAQKAARIFGVRDEDKLRLIKKKYQIPDDIPVWVINHNERSSTDE